MHPACSYTNANVSFTDDNFNSITTAGNNNAQNLADASTSNDATTLTQFVQSLNGGLPYEQNGNYVGCISKSIIACMNNGDNDNGNGYSCVDYSCQFLRNTKYYVAYGGDTAVDYICDYSNLTNCLNNGGGANGCVTSTQNCLPRNSGQ